MYHHLGHVAISGRSGAHPGPMKRRRTHPSSRRVRHSLKLQPYAGTGACGSRQAVESAPRTPRCFTGFALHATTDPEATRTAYCDEIMRAATFRKWYTTRALAAMLRRRGQERGEKTERGGTEQAPPRRTDARPPPPRNTTAPAIVALLDVWRTCSAFAPSAPPFWTILRTEESRRFRAAGWERRGGVVAAATAAATAAVDCGEACRAGSEAPPPPTLSALMPVVRMVVVATVDCGEDCRPGSGAGPPPVLSALMPVVRMVVVAMLLQLTSWAGGGGGEELLFVSGSVSPPSNAWCLEPTKNVIPRRLRRTIGPIVTILFVGTYGARRGGLVNVRSRKSCCSGLQCADCLLSYCTVYNEWRGKQSLDIS